MADKGTQIFYEELHGLLGSGSIVLIDVREPDELKAHGRIPTSINIPSHDLGAALQMEPGEFMAKYGAEKPTKHTKIAFTCRSGNRAALAYETAIQSGYLKSVLYKGSFTDWLAQGGLVEK